MKGSARPDHWAARPGRRLCGLLAIVFFFVLAADSRAADMFWSNSRGDGSGTFSVAGNWTGGSFFNPPPPDGNDVAHFGMTTSNLTFPATYTVAFTTNPTNQALVVEDDRVTFDLNAHVYLLTTATPIRIGTSSSVAGVLTITDGTVGATAADSTMSIGAGGNGFLTVTTGGLLAGSLMDIRVGDTTNGTLTINNNGDVIADDVFLGRTAGRTGTATITGSGSSLLSSQLIVGHAGTGTLNITESGRVDSTLGIVGEFAGSTGTATVKDAGSRWNLSDVLFVGINGAGTLNITESGRVDSKSGIVGGGTGDIGTATVNGAGSKWIVSGQLHVGAETRGILSIKGGGQVEDSSGLIGVNNGVGQFGFAEVKDANSKWTHLRDLQVGLFGNGTLSITGGGMVENIAPDANVTVGSFGMGTVDVDGPNSRWINASNLIVGDGSSANSVVNITGGGFVQNADAILGDNGGRGTVNVDGPNSRWINASRLAVGGRRFSSDNGVNITGGGFVENEDAILGFDADSVGTVVVSDPGSRWTNTGDLYAGEFGTGTVSVVKGGRVDAVNGYLGFSPSGIGTVTVDGPTSVFVNSGALSVGAQGHGELHITGGGKVMSGTGGIASFLLQSTGAAIVGGGGSTWEIADRLAIGVNQVSDVESGAGSLRIQAGGAVIVGQKTVLGDGDLLSLEGGALSTNEIDFLSATQSFSWTSGRLSVQKIRINTLTIPNGGVFAPGRELGETSIDGDLTSSPGATTEIQIGGPTPGTFDFVNVAGGITLLGGNLEVSMLNGFVPSPADAFTVLSSLSSAFTGSFANVASGQRLTTSDGLGSFLVTYGPGSPQVVLSAFLAIAGLPGDYNSNGAVENGDLTLLLNNWGAAVPPTPAGWTGFPLTQPAVDNDELTALLNNWGNTLGASAAVPEPPIVALACLAVVAVLCLRVRPAEALSMPITRPYT